MNECELFALSHTLLGVLVRVKSHIFQTQHANNSVYVKMEADADFFCIQIITFRLELRRLGSKETMQEKMMP